MSIKKFAFALAALALVVGVYMVPSVTHAAVISNDSLNTSNLGNLLILDSLFGGNSTLGGSNSNLGNLLILDQLFGTGSSNILGTGTVLGGTTSSSNLGNLLILDQLFGNSSGGIFDGGSNNLGNLLILDKIFGK